jgi:hypothetical protein
MPWASDLDHAAWLNGEEPGYRCDEHQWQSADERCPQCEDEAAAFDLQQALVEELGPAQATDELLRALERVLAKRQAREDEAMGRDMALRLGRGRE